MQFCPHCGAERRHSNAHYCYKCGCAFTAAPISLPESRPRQRKNRLPLIIGSFVLVIAIIAAVVAFGPGRSLIEKQLPVDKANMDTPEISVSGLSPTEPPIPTTSLSSTGAPVETATPPKASSVNTITPVPVHSPEPTNTPEPTPPLVPTATPIATATPLPTATPKLPEGPPPVVAYYSLSFRSLANAVTTQGYVNPPLDSHILGGILFDLGQGESITTQANPLPDNPTSIQIPVDLANPQAIFLLITAGDLFNKFDGQKLGEVRLHFSKGDTHVTKLRAGGNIREWKHYQDNVVSRTTSPSVTEVWSGQNSDDTGTAVIDILRIDVPQTYHDQSLTSIEIVDQSVEIVGDKDPAINLLGITVAVLKDVTPTPVPIPAPPPCNVQPQGEFEAVWQKHRSVLGCPIKAVAETGGASQHFKHGRMIWRKDIDRHYVLLTDGSWQSYADEYEEGMQEPEGYQAPAGLVTPVRGFGIVWRNHLGGPQSVIGWGLEDEYWIPFQVQDFEKGLIIELEGRVYVLGNNGERWLNP